MESKKKAKAEDAIRVKCLERAIRDHTPAIDRPAARILLRRLLAGLDDYPPYPTPASSQYSRLLRRAEVRTTSDHLTALRTRDIAYFTAVTRRWVIAPEDLTGFDVRRFMERFRYHLRNCGAEGASGMLVAHFHGEFEPHEGVLWPHVHGVASGGMIDVLERLKRYYRRYDLEGGPRTKVLVSPERDRPKQLSYVFQSYWPCRYRGPAASDPTKIVRQRKKGRLPEPVHTIWLTKMDGSNPADLILIVGSPALSHQLRRLYKERQARSIESLQASMELN